MNHLEILALKIRLEISKMLLALGFGHLGGSFSIVETLAVLYGKVLKVDPKNPKWEGRDYFVLSKGHAGPALYSTLALKGFFPLSWLATLNQDGTNLPSHPDRLKTPGVDATTGSLGQGVSQAVGIAKALKMDNKPNRVYTILGDGELNEGQVWEAAQFAAHNKLDNLIIMVDENHKQLDGTTASILNPFDLRLKFEAFGFHAIRVKGNDLQAIEAAINRCHATKDQASVIILDTIKGQGSPYFEKLADNHHIRFANEPLEELKKTIAMLEVELKGK